jgi:hypothetical protein
MGKIDSQMEENQFSDGRKSIPKCGEIESNLRWGKSNRISNGVNRFLRWGREYLKDRRSPPIDLHYV